MPPPAAPTPHHLRAGDLLVVTGALLIVGFSFAPFVSYGGAIGQGLAVDGVTGKFNAWSLTTFMVPLTTFVVAAAVLCLAGVIARFWLRDDPELLGFRLRQLEVGLALFGFVVLLGMVASDKHVFFGARRFDNADAFTLSPMDVSYGAVLMLVGAMIALAGTVLNHFGIGPLIMVARPGAEPAPPPADPAAEEPEEPDFGQPSAPPAAPPEPNPWQRPPEPGDQGSPR